VLSGEGNRPDDVAVPTFGPPMVSAPSHLEVSAASGDKRALRSAEEAISNPLMDDLSLRGARGVLISITGGKDLTLYEVDEAATRIREEVDADADIILGAAFDESLDGIIRVSVVATGVDQQRISLFRATCQRCKTRVTAQTPADMPEGLPFGPGNLFRRR
jgi:cell division GTPase FtsZ